MTRDPLGKPDLSIIIVNWNTVDLLQNVLISIYANHTANCTEIIVIDNASDDGSSDMVAHNFPEIVLVKNSNNLGFAAANNQGFRLANGRYILLLNSDTIILDNVLTASMCWMDRNPQVGAMGCRVLNLDRSMQRTCSMWPSLINLILLTSGLWKLSWPRFLGRYQMMDWQRDSEREVESISGCYLMLRRVVLNQIGLLDESFFFFGEETDWCRRMRAAGWQLKFAPVGEIIHYGSASARKLNHKRDLLLTEATVRLHYKHNGNLAAASAWSILFLFNFSRAIFWTFCVLLTRKPSVFARAQHFCYVVIGQLGLK